MEAMTIQIFNRDFTACAPGRLALNVEQLTWKAQGGPAEAFLSGETRDESWGIQAAQWALDALRRPVEIHDQTGERCWWGTIHRVEVHHQGLSLVYDLSELANRVCVAYSRREPQLEWMGVKTFTPWLDDVESQQLYGIKERIFRLGSIEESEAFQACSTLLAQHGRPQPLISISRTSRPGVHVRLVCRGWWETLSWKVARFNDGHEGFVRPAQTVQALGRSTTSDAMLAQSFRTGYGNWQAGEAVVTMRVVGLTGDAVRCELCADAGGSPGGVLASAEVSGSVISGARWWVKFALSPRVSIDADTDYWLVLSRTGTSNAINHYQVYLDSSNGYPNGRLKTWNGSTWLDASAGMADINFYVVGYVTRMARLTELAGAALGGQFLSSLLVRHPISGDTLLWREGMLDCGEELSNLLQTCGDGNLLLARVDADRRLVIEAAPGAGDWSFSLDRDGRLRTRSGRLARAADQPAGQRALLANGWDEQKVLLSALKWTPESGLQVQWDNP